MRKMTLIPAYRHDSGDQYFAVTFEDDGWIWGAVKVMTRDEVENECDLDWVNVEAVRLRRAPEPEPPFDPLKDYGVSDHDFI